MPTKTDRILSYLPSTFRTLPRAPILYSVVDAFGNDLLQAENSLAAVMLAHWVDHADRNAELIQDLACIAAMYGLAPRGALPPPVLPGQPPTCPQMPAEETVEEFREHLKRYVRTFLEGTVTVQGVLRVVAEALGLHIADAYAQMDTWWTRPRPDLITIEPDGPDAAALLFGATALVATGQPVRPARVAGTIALPGTLDLRNAAVLRLKVDRAAPLTIDLTAAGVDPAAATLDAIIAAIRQVAGAPLAGREDASLTLASPTLGPASRLEVQDVDGDAAPALLGLPPRRYSGAAATPATVSGTVDLQGGADLHEARYLRLVVDGSHLAEVDCAGANAAATTLAEIVQRINAALGLPVATHNGHVLSLTSPTTGPTSSISFQSPAAQDATARLFGPVELYYGGQATRAAQVVGTRDLSQGVDLSSGSQVRLRLDRRPPITLDCAGSDPAHTTVEEILEAFNTALGVPVATFDGRFLRLTSPTTGPTSRISFDSLPSGDDATDPIFGIGSRVFQGTAPTHARLVGAPDLSVLPLPDLAALYRVRIALDGGSPVEVDVRAGAANRRAVTLDELRAAINAALKQDVASHDNQHLILTSPTTGAASRVAVEPLERVRQRRFVTRAFLTDEAAQVILGFTAHEAQGQAATAAHIGGGPDLSRGVDLRDAHFLRISVDGQPPRDINFADPMPTPIPRLRAVSLAELVAALNAQLGQPVAAQDGRRLSLTSPSSGAGSRLAFAPPRAADALGRLLGVDPATVYGQEATRVKFTGTVDLSAGLTLPAPVALKLGIDGAAPQEIVLPGPPVSAGPGPGPAADHLSPTAIAALINHALNANVASTDGPHVVLTSPGAGATSQITFAVPAGTDATGAIFGITPPRTYQGTAAGPAVVIGGPALAPPPDLHTARFLRIAVDGGPPQDVDCAAGVADPTTVTLAQIVSAINTQLGFDAAHPDGPHLALRSQQSGGSARLDLLPYTSGDARALLFGAAADAQGTPATPATLTGTVDLRNGVDLSARRTLRLTVDGGRPVDLDVAGAATDKTFLDEIVTKINAVLPGLAAATPDDRLQLTAPRLGEASRLAVVPLRTLELLEYPPQPMVEPVQQVRHGARWSVDNNGAADADLRIELSAPNGVAGPALVNHATGGRLRVFAIARPGERICVERDPTQGLRATIRAADDTPHPVPAHRLLAGPLGAQVWVPFAGKWRLSEGTAETAASLQLNNPLAPAVVVLQARQAGADGDQVVVQVAAAEAGGIAAAAGAGRWAGQVRAVRGGYQLVAPDGTILAALRPGPDITLSDYTDRAVVVYGTWYPEAGTPVLVAARIQPLFDVVLRHPAATGTPPPETYQGVTIGQGADTVESLVRQIMTRPSLLVQAEEADKALVLGLPQGRVPWTYLDCHSAHFNHDALGAAHFAGGVCADRAVFNLSRFARTPPEPEAAVFAGPLPEDDPPVEIRLTWTRHQPGSFVVNLPADLPEAFGSRFGQARFGHAGAVAETYSGVVLEPAIDPAYLPTLLIASKLVKATAVQRVPIGWEAQLLPLRHPATQTLIGGTEDTPAQLYLKDPGAPDYILVQACLPGAWGNSISLAVRQVGPAFFDVTIGYQGARFENARQSAQGGLYTAARTEDVLKPGPVGVLQAKAAGILAAVTRDRT